MESKSSIQFALVRFLHRFQRGLFERRYTDESMQWTVDTHKVHGSIESALIKETHADLYNLISKHLAAIIKTLYHSPITGLCVSKLELTGTSGQLIQLVEYFAYDFDNYIKCSCRIYRGYRITNAHTKYADFLLSFMPEKFIEDFKWCI